MLTAALQLAAAGWPVFPLTGKVPTIPSAHPQGDPLRGSCKGECGRDGHGMIDATTDPDRIGQWWSTWPGANVGVRPPQNVMVLDVDPRHDGDRSLDALQAAHGPLPVTLTAVSGRGDGGAHRYYRRPVGKISARGLGPGIDLKTCSGYVVAPPSVHPDTGRAYAWVDPDAPVADPPAWLVEVLRPAPPTPAPPRRPGRSLGPLTGDSIADLFTEATTWRDVLEPHGWRSLDVDGDADGARWLHPAATSSCSATVRHGCLFVYSTSTVLPTTETGDPHGLTRFRAWAHLNHRGDLSAAARALRETGAL